MRVLVTGGTGFLGAAIVRALHARGHTAVTFARRASAASLPGVAIDGDIRDRVAVRRATRNVDAVVHTAALVSMWRLRPREFDEINVDGLHNVLAAAREMQVRRVVYTSSFLALAPAGADRAMEANDYQRTKVRALEAARQASADGHPLVILFPGVVYGPGPRSEGNLVGRLVDDHLRGRLPGLVGAQRIWSYSFVSDVADAHISALETAEASGEYVVGGENAPQLRVFEIVRRLTGARLPRRIPFAAATAVAVLEETRTRLTRRPPLLTRGVVDIFRHDWPLDSGRSVRELSYRITPLEQGLKRVLG